MTFGERLKHLREENDEKQSDIAKLLFVTNGMISFYEKNIHFPNDPKALITLAQHFNVSLDYLLGMTNIKSQSQFIAIYNSISTLSTESLNDLSEYIEYLKFKETRREKKSLPPKTKTQ